MLFSKRNFRFLAALALVAATLPVVAGLVDFSDNLLNYVARQFSPDAPKRLLIWKRLLTDMKSAEATGARQGDPRAETLTLRKTNEFMNQVPYINDSAHWGKEDYWATPVEMLSSFGGDCEDYSIAKYLSLKELGIPIERLRISYVKATSVGESHMVLAYYPRPDADPLILDNLVKEVKPASQRPDLEPVYSFNDDDIWLPSGATRKGGASQVRLWRELLEKLAKEQRL
ncbi:sulfate adenylyltransferase [Dechloromonas sp. TW-R-39-2]|uniref:transglutaminase-like cysteine peptidase n=1 Tax=Dechloromonas sp. TW-R-39-2 TaxID=2654218 RepID=UPI00193DA0D7|nr:transglutaminase-like cysteine peptidase [Dechloromonas sp. TW-R-39-2]QRM20054.1 sulfate adenylyltransferase [Dechloromonas sp. TW-R-39-2]